MRAYAGSKRRPQRSGLLAAKGDTLKKAAFAR